MNSKKMDSLKAVISYVQQQLAEHPERDREKAIEAALAGKKREFPVIYIGHLGDPADTLIPQGELEIPKAEISNPRENALIRDMHRTADEFWRERNCQTTFIHHKELEQ